MKTFRAKGNAEAIAFYKRALEPDPDFAVAYASLGLVGLLSGTATGTEKLGTEPAADAHQQGRRPVLANPAGAKTLSTKNKRILLTPTGPLMEGDSAH